MTKRLMHLTGFMLYSPAPHTQLSWVYPPEKIRHQWHEVEYWEEIARTLEEGRFDMFFFADGWSGGSAASTRWAIQFPTHDPVTLIPRLSAVTEHLGFGATMSTTFYPPFMLARKLASLDHITKGRIGWNIVTSINDAEARNFGTTLPPHDERYDRADEYLDLVCQLWDSWEPDAVVMDMENKVFADPEKVHRTNFEGKWYSSAGPLNVIPSPQGQPVRFQAGASERGREFAARWADCVFSAGGQPEQILELRSDISGRMERYNRDPADLRIITACGPVVAASEAEAQERAAEISERIPVEAAIANMSGHWNIDLTRLPPDTRLSELGEVDGTRGMVELYKANGDPTLAEVASEYLNMAGQDAFVGTPAKVADTLEWLFEDGQVDGFQLSPQWYAPDYYRDIVDLLIPELQARGLVRTEYSGSTLRDTLAQNTQT
jgi:FMN-dependent oxidoreductase (nitrilotriacetate monooxygenase family)